ncbi:YbaB/EbfC family nucleoid-associated protein [Streptomyces sp. NPDC001514]
MTEQRGPAARSGSPVGPSSDAIQRAVEELQQTVSALEDAEQRMRAASYTGRAGNGCAEVTVGAQGELTQVKFLGDKYRSMPGEELGAAVLEAARQARARMAQAMLDTFRPLTEQGQGFARARGKAMGMNWDRIFGQFEEDVEVADAGRKRKAKPALRDEIVEDPEIRAAQPRAAVPESARDEESR